MIPVLYLMMVTVFVLANLAVDVLNAALSTRACAATRIRGAWGLQSFQRQ